MPGHLEAAGRSLSRDGLLDKALGEIEAAAGELRAGGSLSPGFEEELDRAWDDLAADPAALEPGRPAASPGCTTGPAGALPPNGARRLLLAARRSGPVAARRARRAAGPRLRAAGRAATEVVGRAGEAAATLGQVETDRARRFAASSGPLRRLSRLSPSARAFGPSWRQTAAVPPLELEEWVVGRLGEPPGGALALHVECGDGHLLAALVALGFEVEGADPGASMAAPGGEEGVVRAGALEFLGRHRRASLDALVLSAVTERLRPSTARALVHLASTRLRGGGHIAVLSALPDAVAGDDPVASDLGQGRPLHPVTWCHLLARYGFSEITVHDGEGSTYAVAARRR